MAKEDSADPSALVNAGLQSVDDELLDLIEEVDAEGSAADNAEEVDASASSDAPSSGVEEP
jgi:hypothetical protein